MEWTALAAAFGGGMWGASVGAVPAFIFTGLLAIFGAIAALSGHGEVVQLAFGPVFGPHVSFGGGVAAAAFAGSRGFLATGRDIGTPLMGLKRVDVLFVGGVFGALGWLLNSMLVRMGAANWTDTIALTVVLTAVVTRFVFGKTSLFGTVSGPTGRRFRPDDSATWLPWQQDLSHVLSIGLAVGLMAAFLASGSGMSAGSDALAFGIATTVLIFLVMGKSVPVTHHIALPAAVGVLHGAGFVGGVACGMCGAVIGEVASRVFLIHGDTHIDPPAVGIAAVVSGLKVATALGWISGLAH
ncbi:MAG TPA: hypothetical protein VM165_09050 [Planctomycetaceae bacterium]|nr:hypothetical protein [Planctomycetaceae bacterium]